MKIGNEVRLVQPEILGVVVDTTYDKDTQTLRHLVEWGDAGAAQQRWFYEDQLEAVDGTD